MDLESSAERSHFNFFKENRAEFRWFRMYLPYNLLCNLKSFEGDS